MAVSLPSCFDEKSRRFGSGAHARIRTGDLFLTKEMLYRLSYVGGALRSILSAGYCAPDLAAIYRALDKARRRLKRVTPEQAAAEHAAGAVIVDTRPSEQRRRDGEIPGAVVVDRNVLEWRLDPTSPDRIPEASSRDLRVILICNEGFSSSLAAASLQQLGLINATDVIGGFQAWKAAGLPVED